MTGAPDDPLDTDTERVPGLELLPDEADPADVVEQTEEVPALDEEEDVDVDADGR